MIRYFKEDTDFRLNNKTARKSWIIRIIETEGYKPGEINFIFCSDEYLLDINRQYLNHNTYTDIITFDQSESEDEISGDIFISIDRITSNAAQLATSFNDELDRVMIHGILHLCGFGDKSADDKKKMRKKEDVCLSLR